LFGDIHYICVNKIDNEMKIVADRFIPFLEGVFEPYAEVVYKDGPDYLPGGRAWMPMYSLPEPARSATRSCWKGRP
jgi:hypothetical protein